MFAWQAAAAPLPNPSGPYTPGRIVYRWTDASRSEVQSSKAGDERAVVVRMWYPAAPVAGAKTAPYVDRLDELAHALPRSQVSLARSTMTHSVADAPVASMPAMFPVILFSPGSATIPALYTTFGEDLANHGYVVAAVDHPYDDEAVLLPDGRVVKQAKEPDSGEELLRYVRERVTVREQDIGFVIDQLAKMQT